MSGLLKNLKAATRLRQGAVKMVGTASAKAVLDLPEIETVDHIGAAAVVVAGVTTDGRKVFSASVEGCTCPDCFERALGALCLAYGAEVVSHEKTTGEAPAGGRVH